MPDVPTIAEHGIAGYAVTGWYGLVAPAGTPSEILQRLADSLDQVRTLPDVRQRLKDLDCEPVEDTPTQFRALIASELRRYSGIARRGDGSAP